MKYAVIFGGNSYEHEISIISAIVLKKVFHAQMRFIFCDSTRGFYLVPEEKMNAESFSSAAYKKFTPLNIAKEGFYLKKLFGSKKLDAEIYINLIHGSDGEDGKLAGMLEFFNIKFIGARLEASVLSFNKELTKLYASSVGVKTLPYEMLRKGGKEPNLSFPCILKPARLGSSIGISVVQNENELEYAKDLAFEFDSDILVEPFKKDIKEYNLAGCKVADEFVFSMIEEPKKKELLDFEQKYLSFSRDESVSEAPLNETLKEKLKEAFVKIYEPLFKGALIRCDFFVLDDEVYINEINPQPGSLANYLFKDFSLTLERLARSIKNEKLIKIDYTFLHSINGQKGKL